MRHPEGQDQKIGSLQWVTKAEKESIRAAARLKRMSVNKWAIACLLTAAAQELQAAEEATK